jgi:tetratricopeptide (TPR) repeat protein
MLDCHFYGLKPAGHHLSNVVLHTVAVVLLFLVLFRLTGKLGRSALVAALFAIHPLHVESVAWIAERKDVLSGVFFMLTLSVYTYYVRAPSAWRYGAVVFCYALGLMSKPMLVTLPFVLLLLDYWPLSRMRGRRSEFRHQLVKLTVEKIPLIAISAASSVVTLVAQRDSVGWTEQLPMWERINNAIVTYAIYLWQMFWPVKLVVFYLHPENRLTGWEITIALAVLLFITAIAVTLRKQRPYLIMGWLWYLGMLIPVIGLVQVGWQARADRYTYLPQIGLYIMVAWSAFDLTAWLRYQRAIVGGMAAVGLAALVWAASVQTSYWRNSETLWTHALAVTPSNDVAENNLGIVLLGQNRLDEAITQFESALALRSENGAAHANLAKAFVQKGELDQAISHYYKYLEIEPENAETRNIFGTILLQKGRVAEAISQWQNALAVDPENGNAKSNLAWVLATCPDARVRNGTRAVALAEDAVHLSGGNNPILLRTLAAAYAEAGRFPEAIHAAQSGFELATSQHNSALADEFQRNIALYESGTPLRDSSLTDGHSSP